jgi:hypothetical protein
MGLECNGKCIYVKWNVVNVKVISVTSNPAGSTPKKDSEDQLKKAANFWATDNEGWSQKCPKPEGSKPPTLAATQCKCPSWGDLNFVQVDPPLPPPGAPAAAAKKAAEGTPSDFDVTWTETTPGKAGSVDIDFTVKGKVWLIKLEGVGDCLPEKVTVKLP